MNPIPLTITLALGTRVRSLTASELGQALGCPDPGPMLVRLLLESHPQDANRRKGTIGDGGSRNPVTTNDDQNLLPNSLDTVTVGNRKGCRGREGTGPAVDNPEALAAYLAERLHDWRSLPFYRKVARRLPESVVRDALARALDIPSHAIRRSRGAYFTTIIVKELATLDRP